MSPDGVSSPWRQLARLETMARWYVWSARASGVMYYWETSDASMREGVAKAVAEQGKADWGFTVRMHREGVLSDDDRALAQFMSVELSTIIDCLMHTGTEFSDKAHCSSFSQALYEHVTELAVPLMRLLYSPAETWALPEPLWFGAVDDLRSWLVEWDRVAEDLRVRIDSAWHKLTTVFGEAALEGAPDWVKDSLLPWRSRPAKPAAAPGAPGDSAAARNRLQSQVRRALRESGPTSTPPPTDGLADEHPLEVLHRFEKHLAEFPTEAGSVAWVATYRGMLWSWGEAVNRRPGLREPFVGMAGLHESEEVRELEDQLRELVRTLVRELTPFAEALPEWEFDVRAYLQPAGMLWFPLLSNQGRIALAAVEDVVSERMMDWTDIRTGLDSIRVLAALRGFRQALLPVLNDIVFALRAQWDYHLPEQNKALDQETFGRIDGLADKAMQVVGKLEGRLQEGPKARLWHATNRLYWYYHFLSPDPDASFAYVCHSKEGRPLRINYALLRRERQWGDPRDYDWCLQEAEGALRAMRVATEWLCRLQRVGGTGHAAERGQQEDAGHEASRRRPESSQTSGVQGTPSSRRRAKRHRIEVWMLIDMGVVLSTGKVTKQELLAMTNGLSRRTIERANRGQGGRWVGWRKPDSDGLHDLDAAFAVGAFRERVPRDIRSKLLLHLQGGGTKLIGRLKRAGYTEAHIAELAQFCDDVPRTRAARREESGGEPENLVNRGREDRFERDERQRRREE